MPRLETTLDEFMEVANESLFSQKKTVSELLASAEKSLKRKLKTVGDCEDYLEILKSEAAKFNECIKTLQTVKKKYDSGKLDKRDYREQLRGATALLKRNCSKLQVKLGNVVADTKAITKKDLSDFNKYITGLRKIVMDIKKNLSKNGKVAKESLYDFEMNDILDAALEAAFDLTALSKDADKDKKKTDDGDDEDSESEFKGESLDEVDDDTDDDDDKDEKKKKSKSKKKDDDEDEEDDDKEDDEDSDDDEEDDEDDKDKEDDEEDEDSDDEDEKDTDSEENEDDEEDSDEEDKDDKKKKKKTKSKSKKTTKKDDSDDEDSDEDDEDSEEDDDKDEEKESKESFYSPEVEQIAIEMALRNPAITFDQACQIVDAAEDEILDDYGDQKATEMADELHSHGVPYEKALEMAFDYLGL